MADMSEVVKRLHYLYLLQRKKYLVWNKHTERYNWVEKDGNTSGRKKIGLTDWKIESHLKGTDVIGTFAGPLATKFICFDVDYQRYHESKTVTYEICRVLDELRVHDYHISFSGKKGYHIEIFLKNNFGNEQGLRFFQMVLRRAYIDPSFKGEVEYRPYNNMGVKLPLGFHPTTHKFCGYCKLEDGLRVMDQEESYRYVIGIKRIDKRILTDIMEEDDDFSIDGKPIENKQVEQMENAIEQFKPLKHHEQNLDYSIDVAIQRWTEGIPAQGTRHKTVFLLAMFLFYQGLEQEQAEAELIAWMHRQDKASYSSSWEEAIEDIKQCIKDAYGGKYSLSGGNRDLTVTLDEIKWIILNAKEKNTKVAAFAFLKQSKRHANAKKEFWFTYKNIAESTGLVEKTARNQVNKLIENGMIEVISRNREMKWINGVPKSMPNIYRLNYTKNEVVEQVANVLECTVDSNVSLSYILSKFFTDKELKKQLPRKQYESFFKADVG